MSREEVIAKLISVRHHCFVRGVLGNRSFYRKTDEPPADDFRQAFRTLNRLYVEVRDRLDGHSDATKSRAARRRRAA
jgi:hypothetical protein